MVQLSEKMRATPNLLNAAFRIPTITAYNRLEARPRTENFERSLRAEVRDALWFLTRQWQMGELESEDAGSAINARIITHQLHVDRIALKDDKGRLYNEAMPMETLVEREPVRFSQALRIQTAQYFLQLHSPGFKTKYFPRYLAVYKLETAKEDDYRGQIEGLNLYLSTVKRGLNGEQMLTDMQAGTFKTKFTIDGGDEGMLDEYIADFLAWFRRQYSQPVQDDFAWDSRKLSYKFSVAAPNGQQTQLVLQSENYYQGKLDWYDFDVDLSLRQLPVDAPDHLPVLQEDVPVSFIPTATVFKGMPAQRFWEMEERQLNFGKLNAKTTDHLLLLFAEFGLVYGNDWFVIPYKMAVNTLCEIKGFVVTDVFGDRTLIEAADAGLDNDWQHWSMFNLSNKDLLGSYNRQFFLPSTLIYSLQSDPIEKVNFLRDEMANMVWGVEEIIPDATGKGINGNEAADKTGVQPPPVTPSDAKVRYLLGTTVPENWIPFLPVHKPGSNQDINFQRAAMPKLGVPPKDIIKPKGVMLQEVPTPYFINEEEIPYSGTLVSRAYQRVRWYNGKTYIWVGRYRETGRGEGSSGLAFDTILPA